MGTEDSKLMRLSILFLLIVIVIAAACGDDDASPTPSQTAPTDATPTPDATDEGTGTPEPSRGSATSTPEPSDTTAAIELREFSVDPARTAARPGTVTFEVTNTGEIAHEFVLVRTDLPHAQLPRLDNGEGADESQLDIAGRIDEISPGDTEELTLELENANYVLICNFYTDSTSHYLSGMYDRFVVSDSAPEPDPTE